MPNAGGIFRENDPTEHNWSFVTCDLYILIDKLDTGIVIIFYHFGNLSGVGT
jgi:hypothetical protein